MNQEEHLKAEAASWLIADEDERREKFLRERIRHHKLVRDLLLDKLPTHLMSVLEIGGGPMPVSDLLECRSRVVLDPLSDEYATVLPCPDHIQMSGEALAVMGAYDLAISTNALDHVENPEAVVINIADALKPGGYFAVMCAENNAITNPHPAHEHNLTAAFIHRLLDPEFETVWELNFAEHGYRYGWVLWEGKRGQPAFALLLRKCSGY